jgi:RNA polymerase sigma factor (sigma-70 family)
MPTRQLTYVLQHLRRAGHLPDGQRQSDGQLLERFLRSREEAAITALVRRHGPMVWGVCLRILRDHHHAEDAFQATFLVLVRRAAAVRPREAVGNWLYGVAYQTALKARATAAKRRARERQVTAVPEPAAPSRELWDDLQPLLDREVSRLPAKYRIPLVLCDLEGRPRQEVARQLGWPEGTLSGRLARARQALARRLTQRGVTVTGAALAPALAEATASASLPPAVAASAIRTALMDAAGPAVAGAVSAPVAALMEGVLKDMLVSKLTTTAAVLVAFGLLALGGGLLSIPTAGGQDPQARQAAGKPAPGEAARAPKTDMESFQGIWNVISYECGGKPEKLNETAVFLVAGNRACWLRGDSESHGELYLDPTDRPKAFDLTISKGTFEGIYALDGDTLRLSWNAAEGAKRPRQFAMKPESQQVLVVLKHQKESGSSLNYRRPDGSKVFPPLIQNLIQKAEPSLPPLLLLNNVSTGQTKTKPANGEPARTPRTDNEKLQGVWKVVSYGSGDKPSRGEEILFLVNGNRACWQTKDAAFEGGLYLDSSARPKTYDLATSAKTIEGIYDLDGDTLRLCYAPAEFAPRPRRFAAQPGSGQVLLVLKRQKEFGPDLSSRRPDGSKVLFPSLVERAETGPPTPPPRNLGTPPPPMEGQKMPGLQEQMKDLERRVAALEAKLIPTTDAVKKQPLRVNRVIIVGNEKTPDRVLRDRLKLIPGQVFDAQALRAAEKRLAQFNATVTALEDDGDSVYRDIRVTVKEK